MENVIDSITISPFLRLHKISAAIVIVPTNQLHIEDSKNKQGRKRILLSWNKAEVV